MKKPPTPPHILDHLKPLKSKRSVSPLEKGRRQGIAYAASLISMDLNEPEIAKQLLLRAAVSLEDYKQAELTEPDLLIIGNLLQS